LGIGFWLLFALAFLALQPFSGCLPMQGLSGFDLPPSGKVLLKSNFSKHLIYLQEGAERFSPL
jgi:hypothetical protein